MNDLMCHDLIRLFSLEPETGLDFEGFLSVIKFIDILWGTFASEAVKIQLLFCLLIAFFKGVIRYTTC